jgi:hypothetical protein
LINTNRYIGLGSLVLPLKITLTIVGGLLFIALITKFKTDKTT